MIPWLYGPDTLNIPWEMLELCLFIFLPGNSLQETEQASDFKIFKAPYGALDSHINIFSINNLQCHCCKPDTNLISCMCWCKDFFCSHIFLVIIFLFYLKPFPTCISKVTEINSAALQINLIHIAFHWKSARIPF